MAEFEYEFHDWADDELYPTAAERLRRLNKHISEVSALMVTDTSASDTSTNTAALQKYHAVLMAERKVLQDEVGAASHNPFQRVRRVRG